MPQGPALRRLLSALFNGTSLWPALLLLWLAAFLLCLVGIGSAPLRNWDEGTVAQVAQELSLAPWSQKLLPTSWGEPYLNKPPLVHLLIAGTLGLWRRLADVHAADRIPVWVVRLAPALVSSAWVPLIGALRWRLRPGDRAAALACSTVALTLLPMVRHSTLAMLDGCQLVAMVGLWWALLGARGSRRCLVGWSLVAGLALSCLLLIKPPAAVPLLVGSLVLRWLDRDLDRRQTLMLAGVLCLGMLPGLAWHLFHAFARGGDAAQMWLGQGLARIVRVVEGHAGGPILPLRQLLRGAGPWLLLWPPGLVFAWQRRCERWARRSLGSTVLTAAMVLPLQTQLPWYSLLLWPSFVLITGPALAELTGLEGPGALPGADLLRRGSATRRAIVGIVMFAALLAASRAAGMGIRLLLPGFLLLLSALALGWRFQPISAANGWQGLGVVLVVAGLYVNHILVMSDSRWPGEPAEMVWLRSAPEAASMLERRGIRRAVVLQEIDDMPALNWYLGARQTYGVRSLNQSLQRYGVVDALGVTPPQVDGVACQQIDYGGQIRLFRCRIGPHP